MVAWKGVHQARSPTIILPKEDIMDWRSKAACQDRDTELFFPLGAAGLALDQLEQAKLICRHCEVVAHCLSWALATGQDAGVWGGLSEDERRELRRRQRQAR
jgi:WhiB family transcriptional regulator, redox-sensing transcriptional regulator